MNGWRTIGLFAAHDVDELEGLLAAMPSRSWQIHEVTPLSAHPHDPELGGVISNRSQRAEFLIVMTIMTPAGAPQRVVGDAWMRQANEGPRTGRGGSPHATMDGIIP
ncbi:MAG TPA: muconolactone Delta-isomerase family protein [Mycobacterium sp.]|uniref:muconolactone Delta-isomerase family protein n=1 Tax=Mycobacterium sp. TaxID=1785 RepID=UPI002D4AD0EF|nr:muconolactone Delta-isomerase family protein [Mycobacterium sp.]